MGRTIKLSVGQACFLATLAASSGPVGPADAAVRTCTARLTSLAAKDATEQGAKKKAIDDWLLKAKGVGIASPTWRLAAERRLTCHPVQGPGPIAKPEFECIAVGHACAVLQNPNLSKPQPAAPSKGFGVDT